MSDFSRREAFSGLGNCSSDMILVACHAHSFPQARPDCQPCGFPTAPLPRRCLDNRNLFATLVGERRSFRNIESCPDSPPPLWLEPPNKELWKICFAP